MNHPESYDFGYEDPSMPEAIVCTHCGKRYAFKPALVGKTFTCAACGQPFVARAPEPTASSSQPSPERRSAGPPPPGPPRSAPVGDVRSTLDAVYPDARPARRSSAGSPFAPSASPARSAPAAACRGNVLAVGLAMVIVACFALLLPRVGLQFRVLTWMGPTVPMLAFVAALIGAAGIFWTLRSHVGLALGAAFGALLVFVIAYAVSPYARSDVAPKQPLAFPVLPAVPPPRPYVVPQPAPAVPVTPAPVQPDPALAADLARAEALAQQTAAKLKELQTALAEAADPLKANAALDRTTQLLGELQQLQNEAATVIARLPPEHRQRLEAQYGNQLVNQAFSLVPGLSGLETTPEARQFLNELTQPQSATPMTGQAPGAPTRESMAAQYGAQRVVTVLVHRVPDGLSGYLFQHLPALAGSKSHRADCRGEELTAILAPVDDLPALAARIDFGQVTRIDPQARVLEVTADPARLPPPLGTEADNPRDPDFYARNLADLTCWDARRRSSALDRLKEALPVDEYRDRVVAAVRGTLLHVEAPIRRASLEALGQWGGPDVIPDLLGGLRDSDRGTRDAALRALGHFQDQRAVRALCERLADHSPAAREALVSIGAAAEDTVLEFAASGDDPVALEALGVLGAIGTQKSREPLAQLAGSPRAAVAAAAREALAKLPAAPAEASPPPAAAEPSGDGGEIDALLAQLRGSAQHEAMLAAQRLAAMPAVEGRRKEVADALLAVLEGDNHFSRKAAAEAIGVWFAPESVKAMIGYAEDDDIFVRLAVLRSLGKVKTPEAAVAVARRLGEVSDRAAAAESLREMGAVAEKPLQPYLTDPDQRVRVQVCEILSQVGTKESLDQLTRLSEAGGLEGEAARKAVEAINSRN